jgi:serine/threonine protein kinase
MDFGVARSILAQGGTTTGTIKGTLRYLSPEQAGGSREIGPASDQFALALVLTETLTGRPVYDGQRDHEVLLRALSGKVDQAVAAADQCCPGIGRVLRRALAFMPDDRFPSVGAFIEAVRSVTPPTETLFSLAEWVHRGLEQRAHDAMDAADELAAADSSAAMDGSSPDSEVPSDGSDAGALEPAFASPPASAPGAVDNGWEMLYWDDVAASGLADSRHSPDSWVMIPSPDDEDEWRLVRRREPSSVRPWMMPSSTTVRGLYDHP